jgi:hypothetical protein
MTLKDEFEMTMISFLIEKKQDETMLDHFQKIADDYAIEFYNFMEDNYYQVADGFVKDLNIDESKRVTITTEKALEIFKKEKAL